MSLSAEFFIKARHIACPPSSPMRFSRRLRQRNMVFFVNAYAIAWAPTVRILLSTRRRSTKWQWLFRSFPTARDPRSPIKLLDKSSSIKPGWSRMREMRTLTLSSSTLDRRSLNVLRVLQAATDCDSWRQSRTVKLNKFHSKFIPQSWTPYVKSSSSSNGKPSKTSAKVKWSQSLSSPASLPVSERFSMSRIFDVSFTGGSSWPIVSFFTNPAERRIISLRSATSVVSGIKFSINCWRLRSKNMRFQPPPYTETSQSFHRDLQHRSQYPSSSTSEAVILKGKLVERELSTWLRYFGRRSFKTNELSGKNNLPIVIITKS